MPRAKERRAAPGPDLASQRHGLRRRHPNHPISQPSQRSWSPNLSVLIAAAEAWSAGMCRSRSLSLSPMSWKQPAPIVSRSIAEHTAAYHVISGRRHGSRMLLPGSSSIAQTATAGSFEQRVWSNRTRCTGVSPRRRSHTDALEGNREKPARKTQAIGDPKSNGNKKAPSTEVSGAW